MMKNDRNAIVCSDHFSFDATIVALFIFMVKISPTLLFVFL